MTLLRTTSAALLLAACLSPLAAQTKSATQPSPGPVTGIYHWIHSTGDAEKAFAFYHDVFGIDLARSPFAGPAPAGAPTETIRPASQAGSDPLVWNLTDTKGSRFRNVFMHAPGLPFGLELSEFLDIPRETPPTDMWNPGAAQLILGVRDLDAVIRQVKKLGIPSDMKHGKPVSSRVGTRSVRAILVRDPDNLWVRVEEDPGRKEKPGVLQYASVAVTVKDLSRAVEFYTGLLAFERLDAAAGSNPRVGFSRITLRFPGTDAELLLTQYQAPRGITVRPNHWRIQDVGAPQMQLEVRDLDALIEKTKAAGYQFLSIDAKPIQRAFGRFVFAKDPDGVLVEFVEPTKK
jgi:predicted enzyme related to lactoylglutathione lyase